MVESYFIDVKFFKEDSALKETMPAATSSIRKGIVKNGKVTHASTKNSGDGNIKPQQQRKEENEQIISVASVTQTIVAANPAAPVFRYSCLVERRANHNLANL